MQVLVAMVVAAAAATFSLLCVCAVLNLQAKAANVENGRALAWADAMDMGKQLHAWSPPTSGISAAEEGTYEPQSLDPPDVHQLAHEARVARVTVGERAAAWNAAVDAGAGQGQLRELRGQLNSARAELVQAQGALVAKREEEAKLRQLEAKGNQSDPLLGAPLLPMALQRLLLQRLLLRLLLLLSVVSSSSTALWRMMLHSCHSYVHCTHLLTAPEWWCDRPPACLYICRPPPTQSSTC